MAQYNKYIVEFIGTFFLVLVVGLSVQSGSPLAPLAIGSTLMVMIFAGGHISGGHFNPAVTLAVYMRGKCEQKDVLPYVGAQIGGALLAALFAHVLVDFDSKPMDLKAGPAFLAEVVFTFALAYVILNVATAKGTEGNSFYGLAIGFTVFVGATAVGGISGGAFNPAVAIGASTMGLFDWGNIWIYLIACPFGGALAAVVFNAIGAGGDAPPPASTSAKKNPAKAPAKKSPAKKTGARKTPSKKSAS